MQAFRTAIWVILSIALTVFALMNFQTVEVRLTPGSNYNLVEWPLALVMAVSFLIGFVPPFLMYRAQRWSARRTIGEQERVIADLRTQAPVASTLNTPVAHDVTASPVAGLAEGHPS
jgi:lipopolysaccharide assembly protein A